MTFDEWWDTAPSNATPDTYRGWEESCRQAFEAGREAEREACAVIAETPVSGEQDDITMEAKDRVAAAIRARSNALAQGPGGYSPGPAGAMGSAALVEQGEKK